MVQQTYGIEAGEEALSYGDRWPNLRPKDGDRVRFHFLTTGNDPWLVATRFHKEGEGKQTRNKLCLNALTRGEESCIYCEMDTRNLRSMFGCWLWVEYVLHPRDNPDEDGEAWEQKAIKLPNDRQLTVFMEKVESPKLLWLPAGRNKAWWSQFTSAWMTSGNLQKHLYELHRTGEGRDDTNYVLSAVKEDPLNPQILENDEVKALPTIEEIFRRTLQYSTPRDMGEDSVDSGVPPEDLPVTASTISSDDDLI